MNDNLGYIFLHRKLIDSRIFQNADLLKVFIWCLLKANHQPVWVSVITGRGETEVYLEPGQFIFGRKSAAKSLKMKSRTVYDRIQKLKLLFMIDVKPATHYSIITIINWDTYQTIKKQSNRHPTTIQQPSNTDNNDKNDKNKDIMSDSVGVRLSSLLFDLILDRNPKHKKPALQTWAKSIDRAIRLDHRTVEDLKSVIHWCQSDPFWQNNILSTEKLRKHFDRLYMEMNNGNSNKSQRTGSKDAEQGESGTKYSRLGETLTF